MLTAGTRSLRVSELPVASRVARLTRGTTAKPGPARRNQSISAMASEADAARQGTCFCGAVRVMCVGEPVAVSICHCANCRKLSGAPFSAQALFSGGQVSVGRVGEAEKEGDDDDDEKKEPHLVGFESSSRVERFRCATCASPVYATLAKGKTAVVPLAILDAHPTLPRLQPSHHMYYASRVLDVTDDLPKFVSSSGKNAKAWVGDADGDAR
jgi:hypothetical protein